MGREKYGHFNKQRFTSSGVAFTLLFGYRIEAVGHQAKGSIKQKVKYKRVKSNLCSGSDLVYRDDFRGLALML